MQRRDAGIGGPVDGVRMKQQYVSSVRWVLGLATVAVACDGTETPSDPTGSGGSSFAGGAPPATGGTFASGGQSSAGGIASGGLATGGKPSGGTGSGGVATGGRPSGGTSAGGVATGGTASGGKATGGHASGGSGTGGSATYQPCPSNGNPCKILPLGDSITWGVGDEGNAGYRGPLFATVVAAGQKITFTGSLSNGPNTVLGQTFPQKNEGHSGWGISQVTPYSGGNAGIATVIPSPAFSGGSGGIPNIILLHIGTNDQGSFTATQMANDLSGLLDKIITNAPDAWLVVAQIIPLGYGTNDVIRAYNQAIPGIVQQRVAAGKHVAIVDMYTGFSPSTMLGSDSIHPNSTGYKFMADHWYSAIGSMLPQ